MYNNYPPEIRAFINGRGVSFFSPSIIPKSFNNNFPHNKEILSILSYYKGFKSSSDEDTIQTSRILFNFCSLPADMLKLLTTFYSITSSQKADILRLEKDCQDNKKDVLKDLDSYQLPDDLKKRLLELEMDKNIKPSSQKKPQYFNCII